MLQTTECEYLLVFVNKFRRVVFHVFYSVSCRRNPENILEITPLLLWIFAVWPDVALTLTVSPFDRTSTVSELQHWTDPDWYMRDR